MTQQEAIESAKRGERVAGEFSIHPAEKPEAATCHHLNWRTIFCNDEQDVVECSKCGRQQVVACTFDEEFS